MIYRHTTIDSPTMTTHHNTPLPPKSSPRTMRIAPYFSTPLLTVAWLCLSSSAAASQSSNKEKSFPEEYRDAKAFVNEYRDLRYSCASGTYEVRRHCLRRLSEANDEYRRAKDVLASADPRYYLDQIADASNNN